MGDEPKRLLGDDFSKLTYEPRTVSDPNDFKTHYVGRPNPCGGALISGARVNCRDQAEPTMGLCAACSGRERDMREALRVKAKAQPTTDAWGRKNLEGR